MSARTLTRCRAVDITRNVGDMNIATTCAVDGCVRAIYGNGPLCKACYENKRRHGTTDLEAIKRMSRQRPLIERLWSKFERVDGHWLWTAHLDEHGYGRITHNGRTRPAHRVMYELLVEPVPDDLWMDHLCRMPRCVNPAHLEPVTPRENTLRGIGFAAENFAKTECPSGHPYDEENTHWYDGRRYCKACNRAAVRRRNAKRRGR